ncbi:Outer membrane porin protein 32 [Rubrivivax sp. A210]|uniref:porin n=1 Tax=Rubrivivax sp. A210 TaxID=2772301 RepID=UPI00191B257D|nr:porin [Rubrivivax sp. A210]CAD5372579.1 Outer membrane porin protein 32 [Rubrivivax sp. A210]
MKKSLLALAALTAFAGAASAQSSVTLFGIVDLNVQSVKNGSAGSLKSLSTGGINTNRLGFRGIEDLGGGLRAGFWIEGQINPDTGAGPQDWRRRSTASLIGGFGEIRLGRDYTPTFNNWAAFDPFGTNGVADSNKLRLALGSGAGTVTRADNTIAYFLPAMGGLYGQFQVAAAEGATGNKELSGRVGYAAGPLNVGGAYMVTKKTGTMADDYKTFNMGASFNLGMATLQGAYEKNKYNKEDQKLVMLGALVPLGSGTFKVSYIKSKGDTGSTTLTNQYDFKQFGFGYVYDLSKRTALYGAYARLDNAGTTANGANQAIAGGNAGILRGENSTGYQFGIRHMF